MEYKDKTLKCKDCGKDFVFSSGEQDFFAQKGFDREPIRCLECRKAKKGKQSQKRSPTIKTEEITFHTIKCKKCGKSLEVPFKPKFPDEIYCSACFEAK